MVDDVIAGVFRSRVIISFHLDFHLVTNSSKQIIPKEIAVKLKRTIRTTIKNNVKHKWNTTTISEMRTTISTRCCCFLLLRFKTYNLIWLFSSIFWLAGSVCWQSHNSTRSTYISLCPVKRCIWTNNERMKCQKVRYQMKRGKQSARTAKS